MIAVTPAPSRPIEEGDIDLWEAQLDQQEPEVVQFLQSLLSADESERAAKFYFERDRRRFVVGRGILRMILARYVAIEPRELRFAYGENGKPEIEGAPV